jgi:hypothetical protein
MEVQGRYRGETGVGTFGGKCIVYSVYIIRVYCTYCIYCIYCIPVYSIYTVYRYKRRASFTLLLTLLHPWALHMLLLLLTLLLTYTPALLLKRVFSLVCLLAAGLYIHQ